MSVNRKIIGAQLKQANERPTKHLTWVAHDTTGDTAALDAVARVRDSGRFVIHGGCLCALVERTIPRLDCIGDRPVLILDPELERARRARFVAAEGDLRLSETFNKDTICAPVSMYLKGQETRSHALVTLHMRWLLNTVTPPV
jgi:hypothetical protein